MLPASRTLLLNVRNGTPRIPLPLVGTAVRRVCGRGAEFVPLTAKTEPPMLKFSRIEPSALLNGLKFNRAETALPSWGARNPFRAPL